MTPCDAVSLRWPLPAADLPPLVIAGGGHLPLLSRAHAASASKFRRALVSLGATERPPSVDHRGAIDESLRRSPFGTAVKRALNSAVKDLRGVPPAAGGE